MGEFSINEFFLGRCISTIDFMVQWLILPLMNYSFTGVIFSLIFPIQWLSFQCSNEHEDYHNVYLDFASKLHLMTLIYFLNSIRFFYMARFTIYHWNMWINFKNI
jgi:lipid-A-disaccharide synthase-like uncharacterized protein